MSRRYPSISLICAMVWGLVLLQASAAAQRHVLAWGHAARGLPAYHGDPQAISLGPPGPHRYPEYNTGCYPWYGYGFGVPTYNWGYFGARYRPFRVSHTGYYNDFVQWSYRRGY